MPPKGTHATLAVMPAFNVAHLRRSLAVRGLTPASEVPEASSGRSEEACVRQARLVEGVDLAAHPVGAPECWPEPVAFLDGVQRTEMLAYAGATPILVADIAAGVRERSRGRLLTVVEDRRVVALGRASALAAAGDALEGLSTVALPDDEPPHPVGDLFQAARAVDRARGALEIEVAARFRAGSRGWLIVDGALSESPAWVVDPRIVGIAKSHATLPFLGEALERYLRLPPGNRSSVFA